MTCSLCCKALYALFALFVHCYICFCHLCCPAVTFLSLLSSLWFCDSLSSVFTLLEVTARPTVASIVTLTFLIPISLHPHNLIQLSRSHVVFFFSPQLCRLHRGPSCKISGGHQVDEPSDRTLALPITAGVRPGFVLACKWVRRWRRLF